jgi:hypothetical protein
LKSLKKEAIQPNALKFLPLSVKEIRKKRRLKTSKKPSGLSWKLPDNRLR